ncbi:MAG: ankyrin repeat domain-containing protein [Cyanobacteria bacterium P01_F01_bin.116]
MFWSKVDFRIGFYCLALLLSMVWVGGCGLSDQPTDAEASAVVVEVVPPLIEATLAGNIDEVTTLLQQGIDPNLVYNTNTALTYAARDGFTEIASLLIEQGADVNWIDGEGVTPLILASFKGHMELVKLLLKHNADITVRDQWNRTALDYALRRGTADPIAQLLQSVD